MDKKELENRIDYFTCLDICEEIKKNQLEMEEFYDKYKDKSLDEIFNGILEEIEEWCRLNCCELNMENTIDKNIDFIKITKDDIPLMTKRILSLRNLDNYHECELKYVYRDWYNFRSEVKKFLTDNKVL